MIACAGGSDQAPRAEGGAMDRLDTKADTRPGKRHCSIEPRMPAEEFHPYSAPVGVARPEAADLLVASNQPWLLETEAEQLADMAF